MMTAADSDIPDALAEDIIDVPARLPGVKVVAHTSSFRFNGSLAEARTVGQPVSVATRVEGSVEVAATGRLKVVAQWIRSDDSFHAWSNSCEEAEGEPPADFQLRAARGSAAATLAPGAPCAAVGRQALLTGPGWRASRRRPDRRRGRIPPAGGRRFAASRKTG